MNAPDLLTYFSSPPASILIIGSGGDFKRDDLAALGYEATLTTIEEFYQHTSEPETDGDPACRADEFFDAGRKFLSAGPYDLVLLSELSSTQPFLGHRLKAVRALLKPGGAFLFYALIPDDNSGYQRDDGISKEVLTALYENGFRIKFPKKDIRLKPVPNASLVVARKDKVFLRTYRDGDELNILPMFQNVFNTRRSMAHWKWKFRNNPFGNRKIALAVTEEGTIAAHFCGYAVPFFSCMGGKSRNILSLQGGDTMTHPQFRQMGLGSTSVLTRSATYFFNKFCVDHMPFMYGYNTGHIKKFGERFLGYRYLSPIPYHVLEVGKRKRVKGNFPLTLVKRLPCLTVKEVTRMEDDFDHLFNRASRSYGVLVKKNAAYLKWRYLDCPDKTHYFFAVRFLRRLVGWGVFSLQKDVLIWGDALFEKNYAWTVTAMIDHLLKEHFPHVKRIEGWFSKTPHWWSRALAKEGFKLTGDPQDLAAGIIFFDNTLTLSLVDRHLYYTMGDSDLF